MLKNVSRVFNRYNPLFSISIGVLAVFIWHNILSFLKKNKMKIANILLAATVGTTAMTMFSYLVSKKKNKDFREPRLLGKMVYRAVPDIQKKDSKVIGWILHGSTGLAFTILYKILLEKTRLKSNVTEGILLGFVNGVAAVAIWKSVFSLHPDPPQIKFKDFYGHLILAHIVFATPDLCILEKDGSK